MDEVGCRAEKISLGERHGFQGSGSDFWFWFVRMTTKTDGKHDRIDGIADQADE